MTSLHPDRSWANSKAEDAFYLSGWRSLFWYVSRYGEDVSQPFSNPFVDLKLLHAGPWRDRSSDHASPRGQIIWTESVWWWPTPAVDLLLVGRTHWWCAGWRIFSECASNTTDQTRQASSLEWTLMTMLHSRITEMEGHRYYIGIIL